MIATMLLSVVIGLPVDKFAGVPGQIAVSLWTWAVFLMLLTRVDQRLRLPLMLCLVISTLGEACLSLLWGLYTYWLHNIPLFVPPGHVLLFSLGLAVAPRLPLWAVHAVCGSAAGYGVAAFVASTDTISAALALLFLSCMALGGNRRLYATMFLIALLMELYGTWIGNWAWLPEVPGLPLTSANPPLCVGGFYCVLDLLVTQANRYLNPRRRSLQPEPNAGTTP